MNLRRALLATVALVGLCVSVYLTLFKLGIIGTLACGSGGCETVQLSRWATFLGLPVATWGIGYYVLVLALSVALLLERMATTRGLAMALVVVTAWGLLFSGWLTYLELFVIHAICRWCVGSAVIAAVLFLLAWSEWQVAREPVFAE